MTSTFVIVQRRSYVAIVQLNRPEKLNALSCEMLTELELTFKQLEGDRDVRAVILTGIGERAFSSGTDIAELARLDETGAADASRRGQDVCESIEHFKVPVIAAINGIAAGGGFELALACHMRIASANTEFSLPETKIGMIPAYGGTQRLARIIGSGRALELLLTGRTITSDEALRIGLLNRLTDPDDLFKEAESFANEIVKLAPLAIRACLEAVTNGFDLPLNEGLALEADLFSKLFATDDVREGTNAFLEKREPKFKGC